MENKNKKTESLYKQRPPDKETESLRIWETDKNKHPEEWAESKKHSEEGILIPYKDIEFKIMGFSKAVDKKTNEIKFAWKFKHEEKMVLIYNPSNTDVSPMLNMIKTLGFQIQDVMETLKNVYNEEGNKIREKIK